MSQAASGEAPRVVSWIVAGLAALLLVWRLLRRRR
jgi:MYXO-CTERM domain-containing protein